MKRHSKNGNALADEHCSVTFAVTESDLQLGTFKGTASVFGSLVDAWIPTAFTPGAFTKTIRENGKRFRILYQHDMEEPLARPGLGINPQDALQETENGLIVGGKISTTQRGRDAITLLQDRVIDELSIGWDPIEGKYELMPIESAIQQGLLKFPEQWKDKDTKQQCRIVREARLWEASFVTFGADNRAMVTEAHAVVPFQNLPLADETRSWDAGAAMKRMKEECGMDGDSPDWGKFKKAHVWFDPDKADQMGGYKFPIADMIDGEMMAVPRGIFAAATRIGSANIPDEDVPKMQAHLGRYYKAMDRKAPWDEEKDSLELAIETLQAFMPFPLEAHVGKVLSAKNKKLLQDAVAALQALIAAAEPPSQDDEEQALTVNAERLSQLRNAELALAQLQQL